MNPSIQPNTIPRILCTSILKGETNPHEYKFTGPIDPQKIPFFFPVMSNPFFASSEEVLSAFLTKNIEQLKENYPFITEITPIPTSNSLCIEIHYANPQRTDDSCSENPHKTHTHTFSTNNRKNVKESFDAYRKELLLFIQEQAQKLPDHITLEERAFVNALIEKALQENTKIPPYLLSASVQALKAKPKPVVLRSLESNAPPARTWKTCSVSAITLLTTTCLSPVRKITSWFQGNTLPPETVTRKEQDPLPVKVQETAKTNFFEGKTSEDISRIVRGLSLPHKYTKELIKRVEEHCLCR